MMFQIGQELPARATQSSQTFNTRPPSLSVPVTVSSLLPASCQADAHWLTRWSPISLRPSDAPGTARRFDLVGGQIVRTKPV